MNYSIVISDDFERNFKRLFKKYRSLKQDLANLIKDLYKNPMLGDDLGSNTRKVRMAIASKNKGKSGGARVITYHVLINEEKGRIYLLTIYNKSEQESISEKALNRLKQENELL